MDIDLDRFAAAGLGFRQEGALGVFSCPNADDTSSEVVVHVVDGRLAFYSRRSAGQREVLKRLGEEVPS